MKNSAGCSNDSCKGSLVYVLAAFLLLQVLLGCDYARMKDDEAIQTYNASMPQMPQNTIPVKDSYVKLKKADPETLKNPVPYSPETVERGKEKYGYYCAQCHGPRGKGDGTVGQSFAPLPTDLSGNYVQQQSDGEIFYRTSFGFKRHPPLAYTVTEIDRWAVVIFIRSLVDQPSG